MAKWEFSDGTVLRSGGEVEGESEVAAELREAIATARKHVGRVLVTVGPMPDGYWPLDPASDFTLNALAADVEHLQHVRQRDVTVTTDYREGDDVPEAVREMRAHGNEAGEDGEIH